VGLLRSGATARDAVGPRRIRCATVRNWRRGKLMAVVVGALAGAAMCHIALQLSRLGWFLSQAETDVFTLFAVQDLVPGALIGALVAATAPARISRALLADVVERHGALPGSEGTKRMIGTLGIPELLICVTMIVVVLGVVAVVGKFGRGRSVGCTSCGKRIPADSAYCAHCGSSLTDGSEDRK